MTWTERKKADWGNSMTDFSYEVFAEQMKHEGYMALFENPEDLGAIRSGEHAGVRPASMWQWKQFEELLQHPDIVTAAFYQQDFGTDYLKPTRLILGGFVEFPSNFFLGSPLFDEQGFYSGPLQQRTADQQLVGRSGTGFATTGTEQWPSLLCKWIAQAVLDKFKQRSCSTSSVLAGDGVDNPLDRKYPINEPDGGKLKGGLGKPRECQLPGKERQFHDGAGLTSIGRWDFEDRVWSESPFWSELRMGSLDLVQSHLGHGMTLDRACFEMAVKGDAGCNIVKDEQLKEKLRTFWIDLLKRHGSAQVGLDYVAPGQPFFLRLMKELLAFGDDADRNFLMQGEVGYPVGVLTPLPRTPHMYEEQTSWRLEDDPHMQEEIWRSNYQSVLQHVQFVREHFAEECAEGLMEKLTLDEAQRRFGDKVAVSSLAVLVEDSHKGKKRIIHDATHGTKINNRIRCRDKCRSPSAREKQYLLAYHKRRKSVLLSLVGDISKAHRRFLHCPRERGLLACRILEEDDHIFINNVGTFGVGCASYWWGRISGSGIRLMHEMLGPTMPVELLIFADDLEALAADSGGRRGIVLAFLYLSALGFPFKWSKQRGGVRVEWIGLYSDYPTFRLGLSPTRVQWMINWVSSLAERGVTTSKEFEQGLGRLGFASMALVWEKPFLGPLYAWSSAVRNKKGRLRIPAKLRTILLYLAQRFQNGGELQDPPPLGEHEAEELLFFTDAKATTDGAWVGGFLQGADGSILSWFSEEIKGSWATWLRMKRDPKRIIATLELLATIIAAKLWMPKDGGTRKATCWLRGKTDNQSNTYALTKFMSTKFPLTIFLMELAETLRCGGCSLHLDWIRRDCNQLADDLTNEKFDHFNEADRVRWKPECENWIVFETFLGHAETFHLEMSKRKLETLENAPDKKGKKQRMLTPW